MPLAKRQGLPDNLPLEVGKKYEITGIKQKFSLKSGGEGILVETTEGLRRSTSKVVIGQLTDAGTSFPVIATLTKAENPRTKRTYEKLVE